VRYKNTTFIWVTHWCCSVEIVAYTCQNMHKHDFDMVNYKVIQ